MKFYKEMSSEEKIKENLEAAVREYFLFGWNGHVEVSLGYAESEYRKIKKERSE